VGRLWAWSAESVRWEEKQRQNPHAIVSLPSCGLVQLNLSGGRKNRSKIPMQLSLYPAVGLVS
jgi:hypothetical protein